MKHAKLLSMCAAVAAVTSVSPAVGKAPIVVAAPAEIVTRHISYADLNLATSAGERTLNYRVASAVNGLCDDATGGNDGSFVFKVSMKRCSSSGWFQAQPQIDRAVQRARQLAATGATSLAAAAITISLPK